MNEKRGMVTMLRSEPGEVYETVEADQLRHMAYRGFSLVAVLYTDELKVAQDYESRPIPDPNNSYSNRTETTSKAVSHVLQRPLFLMRQEAESALRDVSDELVDAKDKLRESKSAAEKATEHAAAMEKDLAKVKSDNAHAESVRKIIDADNATERRRNQKLEGDIGKIRAAVGELRMKEILGT